MFEDKTIPCSFIGCGDTFIHSARDQEFYAENKYVDPKYCKFHREQRKADREKARTQENKKPLDEVDFSNL